MEYVIKSLPAMRLAGVTYHGKNEKGEIPDLWDVFIPRLSEFQRVDPEVCFGLERFDLPNMGIGEFEYTACCQVTEDFPLPEGIVERQIPACDYAVFKHFGNPSGLHQTFQKIYHEILPSTRLRLYEPNFDMEVYDRDFMPSEGESIVYIYIAITR